MSRSKSRLGRAIIWIAVALAGLVAIATVAVQTDTFHRFILAKVRQKVETITGARVQMGAFAFRWRGLHIDFYNVVLRGTEPISERPLFAADHIAVRMKILSAWKKQIDLSEIILDRPIASLQIDSRGRNNLPTAPPGTGEVKERSDIFDLAIQHFVIRSGEIYYNDRQMPLSADLHDFHTESVFNNLTQQYKLSAAYDQGVLSYKNFKPIEHNVAVNLKAGRSGLFIDDLVVTAKNSKMEVRGELNDYANPSLDGFYVIQIDTRDVTPMLNSASKSTGQVQLRGNIRYRDARDTPFINAISINGTLASAILNVRTPTVRGDLKAIRAQYRLENGNLYATDAQAETLGGRVLANYQIAHLDAKTASRLDASAQGISPRAVAQAFLVSGMPDIPLAARADMRVQASWTDNIQRGSGRANVIIRTVDSRDRSSGMPLEGKINVAYQGITQTVFVNDSYLHSSGTQASVSGTLGQNANLNVDIKVSDLHELGSLLQNVPAANADKGSASRKTDLRGAARFRGQLSGPVRTPSLTGQLSVSNLDVNGSSWRALQAGVDLNRSGVILRNVSLHGKEQSELTGTAQIGLTDWSFTGSSPIDVHVTATKLSLPDLELLAGRHDPVMGTLDGTISISGSTNNPSGNGSLSLRQATAWNEPITNLTVGFKGTGNSIQSKVQLQTPAGSAVANVTYSPKSEQYDVDVSGSRFKLEMLKTIQARNAGIAGLLTLSAKGHGTVKNPAFEANVNITNLKVRDQSIREIQAQLGIANQHANAELRATLEQTSIDAKGDVDLTGEHLANAKIDSGPIPIGFLLASYMPSLGSNITGQTELHGTLNGPLLDPARIQAHLEIPTLRVVHKSQQISNARPLRISYTGSLIKIDDAEMKGSGTDVKLAGSISTNRTASMDLRLNGSVDLSILKGFQQDLDSSGSVDVQLAARGILSSPLVQGQVRIVNAAATSGNIPIGFENVNGSFTVNGNRIEIGNFTGNAGGGNISTTGFLTYGSKTDFSFNVDANNVRVRYPEGVRSIVGGSLQMSGSPENSTLNGKVLIDRLSFTQDFDIANFIAQFSGETPPAVPSVFQQNMKLNVAVQTASDLNAVSSKLSVAGTANLTVGGTAANPVILGRTTLTSGEVFFLGKRYEVQNGTIEFANPVRTEPKLNLYVTTTVQQYNITLNFVGPIDRLRTNYTSDPSLAPADIINLVAFGKTAEQSASAASTPTSVGAESVLAQGVSGQVSGRIEKLAGISQLSIDPLAGTNPNDPGSQISVQQRVSGNLLLTFSTDVTSTQNQAVQLQYQAKRNVSLSVLRDQNGGYAIDVRVRKVF
jgi:translocation and assembly module TamB